MEFSKEIHLAAPEGEVPDFANGSVFFVGTATIILRYAGFTILTDPNFLHAGDHADIGYGLQAERLTNPAINIEDLPPIDFCILSHYHSGHFDQVVEEKLRKDLPIVTNAFAAKELREKGFTGAIALDKWKSVVFEKQRAMVTITALPGRHGPALLEKFLPPVMGSMLEFHSAGGKIHLRLYMSGDTVVFNELKEIPKKYPDIDVGIFHLGGTQVLGITVTMDAKQGVEAVELINPREVIPVHYNDYEMFKSPLDDFKKAMVAAGLENRVRYLAHGETYSFTVPISRLEKAA